MKTFLKILLAANFLLQISMAHETSKLDEEKGGDTEQHQSKPGPNQDDEGSNEHKDVDTKQNQGSGEPHQDADNEESKLDEDKGGEKYETTTGTEQHQSTPGPNQDNVIYPNDIVPCDTLSTRIKEVQDEIVKIHNEYRSNVEPSAGNMLQMKWSDKLMESAERWAEKCYLNHSEVKDRNDKGVPYGENMLSSPACIKWDMTIKQWYNEKEYLIWGVGPVGTNVIGHYTQLVTDSTFLVGCSVKRCILNGTEHAFYVCQYFPPGNRISSLYRPYDEGKHCSQCPTACDKSGTLCLNSCLETDVASNCETVKEVGACEEFIELCKATCRCKNKII